MKSRFILIRCDCGHRYEVLKSSSRYRQRLILDFALCPACALPRVPAVWHPDDLGHRCVDCGIPFRIQRMHARLRCLADFVQSYRVTKRISLATVEISTLAPHAGFETHREGA